MAAKVRLPVCQSRNCGGGGHSGSAPPLAPGRRGEPPDPDPHILHQLAEPVAPAALAKGRPPELADFALDGAPVSEGLERRAACRVRAHPLRLEFAGPELEVELDLPAHFLRSVLGSPGKMKAALHGSLLRPCGGQYRSE